VDIVDFGNRMFFSFGGKVTAASDKFELSSDRLEVTSDGRDIFLQSEACSKSIKKVHAFGNVKFTQDCRRGTADEVVIDPACGMVTLLGNAVVMDSDGTAHGDRLVLYRDSGSVRVGSVGRSSISIDHFKKNQAHGEDSELCNGCANSVECEIDD
jgi:lipopolysaccharide export system protein LptA